MGYESIYKDKQNQLMDNITNMGEFSYNAEADPAFQAYKKTYGALGDQSMKNTLGEASALTGGRLNSWATSAAQQAKGNYDQQLMAQVPALQQAAYQMFQDKNNNNLNALNAINSADNTAYGRWNDDRNFTYQQGRDEVSDNQWWKNFNYNKGRDTISDKRYSTEQKNSKASSDAQAKADAEFGAMYSSMMSAKDPKKWLAQNSQFMTKEEISALAKYLPSTDFSGLLK